MDSNGKIIEKLESLENKIDNLNKKILDIDKRYQDTVNLKTINTEILNANQINSSQNLVDIKNQLFEEIKKEFSQNLKNVYDKCNMPEL